MGNTAADKPAADKAAADKAAADKAAADKPAADKPAADKAAADKAAADKAAAEQNFRTTRPIWGRSGNIISALKKVTQKDVSTSIDELIKVGHVERFDPKKVKK